MILQNARVFAEISDNTGALIQLKDLRSGMEFVNVLPAAACRVTAKYHRIQDGRDIVTGDTELRSEKACVKAVAGGAELTFTVPQGITVHAKITLLEDGLAFTSSADCCDKTQILLVEYPVVGGMGDWYGCAEMAHAFATGLRVKNPLKHFATGEGVRHAPYPECFSGASMQFYAYYAPKHGGLLFAAEDGESHQKWLNLYRNGEGMEGTMMYGFEDMGFGKSVYAPYPFTVRFLEGKGWWEAAEKYKAWAVQQRWCAMGKLTERQHCEWLLKDVGLTTFGIDASQDRTNYIRHYHEDVNTRVFHVLGPDWAHTTQSFGKGNPGYSLDGWVPTAFNQSNLDEIRRVGDYFAPFEFDLFGHARPDESEEIKQKADANRDIFPAHPLTYSCDHYHYYMMCPCQEHTHDLHVTRDAQIVQESRADAMYYDISANNLLHVCLSDKHNHPVGGGNVLTSSYKKMYSDTKEACATARGDAYFPIGTEMINEVFLPELDYYQARAGAQPCSSLEMWPYKKLLDDGRAELIPLFAYVYHEYGAVRMDGWGKCVEEVGDLFYDSAAKIYLWGGLYELNHEYSPGEAFNGVETRVEDHYWEGFGPFGYEYSPGRARYLRQFAALRTGRGNRYLAYGRMRPEPQTDAPERNKHFYHYNHGVAEIYSGDLKLPAVRTAAWESVDDQPKSYALFLVNTELDVQRTRLNLNAEDYPGSSKVVLITGFGKGEETEEELGVLQKGTSLALDLSLPSRAPVMVEIR